MKVAEIDFQVRPRPDLDCVLIACAIPSSEVAGRIEAATGLPFSQEACSSTLTDGHRVLWLSPRSWVVQCPTGTGAALCSQVQSEFPDHRVHATPYDAHLVWFELAGVHAREILCAGGFVTLEARGLPVGRVKRTSVAGVAAIVFRPCPQSWLIGFERSLSTYAADWMRGAAERIARVGPL